MSTPMPSGPRPGPPQRTPSLPWRMTSAMVMGTAGVVSKCFLYGFNRVEVTGLGRFLDVLDARRDPEKRQRGLITVSNHISVVDDPLVWGVLPLRYAYNPSNLRWSLGAHDICFSNKFFSSFFTYGQVLPTHRLKHSEHGGLFQPSIAQAIRVLSTPQPFYSPSYPSSLSSSSATPSGRSPDSPFGSPTPLTQRITTPATATLTSDPFAEGSLVYSTTGTDVIPSPAAYPGVNKYGWVHIFPEGMVHQNKAVDLRYFKWGVARLILESDPPPDVLPMFIDGTQHIMPEDRTFPRFLPRVGKKIRVAFGEVLDYEETFGDLRRRWRELVRKSQQPQQVQRQESAEKTNGDEEVSRRGGDILSDELKYSREAQEIRIEVARRVREEVLKVRRSFGNHYPDSHPPFGRAETWKLDDDVEKKKKYKSRVDGSQINQD
ncbi:hypothetical protein QBC46DRAFT_288595 [Diplogelasinospora grovesii]|uniref:Tafazzin family protein n=1 Tax=Diplogelasinospora grovesii TaxID=303347 RepID=A0AAN6S4Q6_9PEZI|nr:hypothetical protein QBC46DRAFT_288595 [Diplogelasinospora grovesii]